MKINSKRTYIITGMSNGIPLDPFNYLLSDILYPNDSCEFLFALQDEIDRILDLDINHSLTMFCNRDIKTDRNKIIVYRKQ